MKRRDDRLVLLVKGRRWHVVDIRGSVFEFANDSKDESRANMHVSPSGKCEVVGSVNAGSELVWWYGDAFLHSP